MRGRDPRALAVGASTARLACLLAWGIAASTWSTPVQAEAVRAYVSNHGSGTVSVIDAPTGAVIATVPVGTQPRGVMAHPNGRRVYVAREGSSSVEVIDTLTNTLGAPIAVGANPFGLAMPTDGSRLFVANQVGNSVSVVDTTTNLVTATIPVMGAPIGIAAAPDGSRLYAALIGANAVAVIDTATNSVLTNVPVGVSPSGVEIRPDGGKVYVASAFSQLWVIDTATNTVDTTIPIGSGPIGLAMLPDGSRVYVANQGPDTVSVVNTATNSVVTSIPVGADPRGVSVTPDGSRLYVANTPDDTVSVIDTGTNTVVDTITVGTEPHAFGRFIATVPVCGSVPAAGCLAGFGKAILLVKENVPGNEKVVAKLLKGPMLTTNDFGDPTVVGGTAYNLCVYDGAGVLAGQLTVDRAGDDCAGQDCWKFVGAPLSGGKGLAYKDPDATADGVTKLLGKNGDAGRSKVLLKAQNSLAKGQTALPTGIAAALAGETSVTMQLLGSDGLCLEAVLTDVKKADGDSFKGQ
jgi:YVTN family beta-propeller protein